MYLLNLKRQVSRSNVENTRLEDPMVQNRKLVCALNHVFSAWPIIECHYSIVTVTPISNYCRLKFSVNLSSVGTKQTEIEYTLTSFVVKLLKQRYINDRYRLQ